MEKIDVDNSFEEHIDSPLEQSGFEPIPKSGNFPTFWDMIVMVILIVACQGAAATIGVSFGLPMPEMLIGELIDIEQFVGVQVTRGESFAVIYPVAMIMAFVCIYFYIRSRDGKGRVARTSTKGFSPNVILGGLIWLLAVMVVIEPIAMLFPDGGAQGTGRGFWAIITSVIFAPVFEELIFRGLILESLLRRHRRLFSVIMSSLFFGVIHLQPAVIITAAAAGFVFGTIYLHTNSIFATIILHSINNAIAFALILLGLENVTLYQMLGGGKWYYVVYAVSCVVCVYALVETWRRRKIR